MSQVQHLIQESFSLLQEPIYVNIKYDGENFKVELPAGIESSVVSVGPARYFNLEEAIGSCLLHYMKLKTELKNIKEGALCQDA